MATAKVEPANLIGLVVSVQVKNPGAEDKIHAGLVVGYTDLDITLSNETENGTLITIYSREYVVAIQYMVKPTE